MLFDRKELLGKERVCKRTSKPNGEVRSAVSVLTIPSLSIRNKHKKYKNMIVTELNQLLTKKKLVTDAAIQTLDKEWLAAKTKTPVPWEDFLVEKKALTEDQLERIVSTIHSGW